MRNRLRRKGEARSADALILLRRPRGLGRQALALGLIGLTATACVSPDPPGVRTDSVQTDIVFDVEEPETGPLESAVPSTEISNAPLLPTPFRNELPPRFANVRFSLTEEEIASECPGAPLGAAPSVAAPENASEPPPLGLYRFKRSGTKKEIINGTEFSSEYGGFEPRVLRDLETSSETLWSFKEVEQISDGVRVTSWQVNTDPVQRAANPPYVGENAVRVGEPGRGVAITSIEEYDGNGNAVSSFNPTTPLLLLQLPVVQGESFSSSAVDPKTGQSISLQAEIMKRQTVDACGTLLDGWLVEATITESRGFGTPANVHTDELVISTERGGQLLSRRQVMSGATQQGTYESDLTVSIGQVEPSPAEERG
jgi:hypothetical protein